MNKYFSLMHLKSVLQPRHPWRLSAAVVGSLLAIGSTNQSVGAESVVQIHDNFFSPKQLRIAPNDSVRWVNPGDAFSVTFSNLGSFPYFCQIHGQAMSGTVIVTTNSGAAPSNLFLVNISGSVRSTNALGKIVPTPKKTKDFVADCAADHQLNPANLSLVYDRQADAIQVVQDTDRLHRHDICRRSERHGRRW
jgi:plastocyanin